MQTQDRERINVSNSFYCSGFNYLHFQGGIMDDVSVEGVVRDNVIVY